MFIGRFFPYLATSYSTFHIPSFIVIIHLLLSLTRMTALNYIAPQRFSISNFSLDITCLFHSYLLV